MRIWFQFCGFCFLKYWYSVYQSDSFEVFVLYYENIYYKEDSSSFWKWNLWTKILKEFYYNYLDCSESSISIYGSPKLKIMVFIKISDLPEFYQERASSLQTQEPQYRTEQFWSTVEIEHKIQRLICVVVRMGLRQRSICSNLSGLG